MSSCFKVFLFKTTSFFPPFSLDNSSEISSALGFNSDLRSSTTCCFSPQTFSKSIGFVFISAFVFTGTSLSLGTAISLGSLTIGGSPGRILFWIIDSLVALFITTISSILYPRDLSSPICSSAVIFFILSTGTSTAAFLCLAISCAVSVLRLLASIVFLTSLLILEAVLKALLLKSIISFSIILVVL